MAEEIKTMLHYPIYYHHAYEVFRKYGYTAPATDVKKTFAKLDLDPMQELRVVSVGCANGLVDEPIIDALLIKYPKIKYIAVDPLADELAKFQTLAEASKDKWQNVEFDFHATTIEEYLDSDVTQEFGLIVASQSVYHFTDLEKTIVDLYNRVVKGGMLFIKMVADGWERHFTCIGQYYFDPKMHFIGSQFIKDILTRRVPNIRYETEKRVNTSDVTVCFDEESEDGACIIDQMTQIYKFREFCKPEIKKDILDNFRSQCCVDEDDKILMKGVEEDLLFYKQ